MRPGSEMKISPNLTASVQGCFILQYKQSKRQLIYAWNKLHRVCKLGAFSAPRQGTFSATRKAVCGNESLTLLASLWGENQSDPCEGSEAA